MWCVYSCGAGYILQTVIRNIWWNLLPDISKTADNDSGFCWILTKVKKINK